MIKVIPTVSCNFCGNDFKQWSGDKNKSHWKRKFCSKECQYKSYKKKIDGIHYCIMCNNEIPYRNSLNVRSYNNIYSYKTKLCSKKCVLKYARKFRKSKKGIPNPSIKGKIRTKETREKMSIVNRGSKSHFWKGGISPKNQSERSCLKLKEWRRLVFIRDNYTCQECGYMGNKLNAHHIKSWSKYPQLRFLLVNGVTLCVNCHKLTDNYKNKS